MDFISNKEALKDKIHEIHNYLRNNGAGYGMNALKVFNILYGLKKMEECGLIDKAKLPRPCCEFSHLLKYANENKDEALAELIFGDVLQSICDSELKYLLFYEIPQNIRGSVFAHLIKEIDSISTIERTCNVLLSGKIYEYFIGRDESAISELGAYFTDRHIVDYILRKLNPSITHDGKVSTMIDMFGGSGGFTTGYINYLNTTYPNLINWETEINKIYHYDMNEDVIKSAGLEFFCLTGVLPSMHNLKYKNSFADEFNDQKYTYPLTNPPYGGDKTTKTNAHNKLIKIRDYINKELLTITDELLKQKRLKQLKDIALQEKLYKHNQEKTKVNLTSSSARIQRFAKKYGLKSNDKEGCSLILLMDMVEIGGTAIGVLKEGVVFGKTYKDLRKCLVENFNVREIISVPRDQFENTATATSIIIFDNTEVKTSSITFRNLVVERYPEDVFAEVDDKIVIVESKGDIKGVSDVVIINATKNELLTNKICSFDSKDYHKKHIVVNNEYDLVTLGDICEFMPKSKRNASFGQTTGQYNFYTSSDKVKKCDVADYDEECLIIGSGGVANIKMDSHFSCSADNFIIKTKYNQYIYNIFKGNMNLLSDGFSGSVLKHISKDYLKAIQIPIPKSPDKMKEWIDKISAPYNEKTIKECQLKELEQFIQHKIKNAENEVCDEVELGKLTNMVPNGKHNTSFGKSSGKYKFYNSSNEEKLFCDEYEIEDESIIIGFKGNINIHFGKQFTSSQHMYVLQLNPETQLKCGNIIKYLYYYLEFNKHLFTQNMHGSTIKHITKHDLNNTKIKLPTNKQFIQELEPIFQQINMLHNEIKCAEELYKKNIQSLSQEVTIKQ